MFSPFMHQEQTTLIPSHHHNQERSSLALPALCSTCVSPQERFSQQHVQAEEFLPFNFGSSLEESWSLLPLQPFISDSNTSSFAFLGLSSPDKVDQLAHEALLQPFEAMQPLQFMPWNQMNQEQFKIESNPHEPFTFNTSSPLPPPHLSSTLSLPSMTSPPLPKPTRTPPTEISPKTGKPKKMRFKATPQELTYLLGIFQMNPFPSTSTRKEIAEQLGLTERQILFWFQNRRACLKTNGIVAVKPRGVCGPGGTSGLAFKKKKVGCGGDGFMSPLSASNPFFYVNTVDNV
ncbi:UNVERIFIED_CONTAM: hypothetical protein HDU68_004189 [Siphonaria sp. JEL0065]|nr:hypothetical protein HDU68_004189 [Siphonaria sp. JEL0065]